MGFDSFEKSRQKGQKITLYHFFYVNNQEFHYTDSERAVTIPAVANAFTPMPIRHGNLTSSGSLDKATLEIRMPRRAPLAEGFRVYPPNEVVNVIIRQMQLDDPSQEALVAWTGRVMAASWEDSNEVVFSCEPISTSLRRPGLRRNYQLGCPHALYGTQCAASKLLATTPDIVVTSVSGTIVELQPGWIPSTWLAAGKNESKFIGGMMVWDAPSASGPVSEKRTVIKITDNVRVLLGGVAKGLAAGSVVRMVLGCNHQMSDCENVHNNIKHFGGQPWIPLKTPFGFNNNFY